MVRIAFQGQVSGVEGFPLQEIPVDCFLMSNPYHCERVGSEKTDAHGNFLISFTYERSLGDYYAVFKLAHNPQEYHLEKAVKFLRSDSYLDLGALVARKFFPLANTPSPSPRLRKVPKTDETTDTEKKEEELSSLGSETPPEIRKSNRLRIRPIKRWVSEQSFLTSLCTGIAIANFKKEGKTYHFELLRTKEIKTKLDCFPDVRVNAKREKKALIITSIALRENEDEWVSKTPEDGDFKRTLHLAHNTLMLKNELEGRLAFCILLPSLLSVAAANSFKDNPIGSFLAPFLSVDNIPQGILSKALFTGEAGVLKALGLSIEEIIEGTKNSLCRKEFTDFKPRARYYRDDRYAQLARKFWDNIIIPIVSDFFEQKRNQIIEAWSEIYHFSKQIEKFDIAIEALTLNREEPENDDMKRLRNFCGFVLFLTTFEFTMRVLYHDKSLLENRIGSLVLPMLNPGEGKRSRAGSQYREEGPLGIEQEKRLQKKYYSFLEHPMIPYELKKYFQRNIEHFPDFNLGDILTQTEK